MTDDKRQEPLVDQWLHSLKNRRAIAFVVVVSVAITGIASLTDSVQKIRSFLRGGKPEVKTITIVQPPAPVLPVSHQGSTSVEELISLLDFRFKDIIADIEKKKNEPDELGRYKGINDADETGKNLAKLHEEIKESLKRKEFTKAHELMNEFRDKLESFYIYPLTLTQKRRYAHAPEPGQDPDYDDLTRAVAKVRESSKAKYPGPEVDSFLAAVAGRNKVFVPE